VLDGIMRAAIMERAAGNCIPIRHPYELPRPWATTGPIPLTTLEAVDRKANHIPNCVGGNL